MTRETNSEAYKVLAIEDDEDDYLITRDMLTRHNGTRYEVEWRASYDDGLEAIREQRHDVYLIDYQLGAHTGLQLIRRAFSSRPSAPIIVLTGREQHEVDVQATALGVSDYLVKQELYPEGLERAIRYAIAHHRALTDLREAEERFRQAFDHAPIGMSLTSLDGVFVRANQALSEMLGRPMEELAGMRVEDVTHPDDRGQDAVARAAMAAGELSNFRTEKRYLHADGHTVWTSLSASAVHDSSGKPQYFVSQMQDISERREIEAIRRLAARLAESEALLAAGEELTAGGSFERDLRTGKTRYSSGLARVLGVCADGPAPSRQAILERIHPEDLEHVKQATDRAERSDEPVSYQARIVRSDGAIRTLRIRIHAAFDEHGAPVKLLGAAQDVTEEQELLAARKLLSYVVDSSDDAIMTKTADGMIASWNRGAERLYGYPAQEAVGKPVSLIAPPERESEQEQLLQTVFSGHSIEHFETVRVRKDGSRAIVSLTVSPVRDERGQIVCAAVVGRDITERKRVEEELRRSNQDLEQFAYVASHDLSEPLRVIAGFVELLARRYRGQLDEDADRFIGFTVQGVERMQVLIEDLLAYSRIGRTPMEVGEVDTAALVQSVLRTIQGQIEERGTRVDVGALPSVRAHPTLLSQVFQNLISNAVKFNDSEHPHVRVTAAREVDRWRFEVQDNGPGIEPEQGTRVFEMFHRLHGREVPGSGIGLAIAKRVVERHAGEIWIEAGEGGRGTVVRFTVPDRTA